MQKSCRAVTDFIRTSFSLNLLSMQFDVACIAEFAWFLRGFYLTSLWLGLSDILCYFFVSVKYLLYFLILKVSIFFWKIKRLAILLPLFSFMLQVSNKMLLLLVCGSSYKVFECMFMRCGIHLGLIRIIVIFFVSYWRLLLFGSI